MNNKNNNKKVIVVAFSALITSGCDYATQTIKILGRKHIVIGFALGEPITWRDIFSFHNRKPIIEQIAQNTYFHPFFIIPGQRWYFIKLVNFFINAVALRTYISLRYSQSKKYLWFFEPFFIPTLIFSFHSYITIFDCVDYFLSLPKPYIDHFLFSLFHARHVFINSMILKNCLKPYRPDATVVPLGFSPLFFTSKESNKKTRGEKITVGFIGGIDDRLDYQLLNHVVKSLPEANFIFVGKNHYIDADFPPLVKSLISFSNVRFYGEVSKSHLSTVLKSFDIGIIPYDIKQPFNRFCFPMKTLEYFFTGLPVISTAIEEVKRYPDFVTVIHTPSDMISEIKKIANNGWNKKKRLKAKRVAMKNSWKKKIEIIEKNTDEHVILSEKYQ